MKASKETELRFYNRLRRSCHYFFYFFTLIHLGHGAEIICQQQKEPRSGICYITWTNYNGTYDQAISHCSTLGGKLPRIPDAETMQFIKDYSKLSTYYSQSSEYKTFWIGLSDTDNNGVFTWWNGSMLGDYSIWSSPPTLGLCGLYNAQLDRWQAVSCYSTNYFVCEFIATSCDTLDGYFSTGLTRSDTSIIPTYSGTKAIYFDCDEGYVRDSGQFYWECVTADYSNAYIPDNEYLPVCNARTCDVTVRNGTVTKTDTNAVIQQGYTGDLVILTCEDGFNVTNGTEQSVICNSTNGWTDTPLCTPHVCNLTITRESMPANMSEIPVISEVTSGYDIQNSLSCDTGYSLTWTTNLPRQMVCDDTGNWTNVPTCEPNLCYALNLDNGQIVTDPADATKVTGVPFTVTCDQGYVLSGYDQTSGLLSCGPMGVLTYSIIACQPQMCSLSSLTLANVRQLTFPQASPFTGQLPDVTCSDGYYLTSTPDPVICTADWINKPTCQAYVCGILSVNNGTVTPSAAAPTGTIITVSCDTGYTLSVQNPTFGIICGPNGVWTSQSTCIPNNCTSPTFPFAALVAFPSLLNRSGLTPEVTCAEGYQLDAGSLQPAVCHSNGTWLNPPGCLANSCGTLSVVSGTLSQSTGLKSGDTVTITCETGYYIPSGPTTTVLCYPNATWINPAVCVGYPCNSTIILNVASLGFNPTPPRSGSSPVVYCQTGYSISPVGTLPPAMCTSAGQWANKPQCPPNSCNANELLTVTKASNVYFATYPNVTSGMFPTITCQQGYSVNVTSTVCLESGQWQNKPPCTLGDCPGFTVANSVSTPQMGTFSGVSRVVCQSTYRPSVGNGTVTCMADRTWSPVVSCEPNPCTKSMTIDNSESVVYQDNTPQTANDVSVSCSSGFFLSTTPGLMQCQVDGTWSNKPTCQRRRCEDLAIRNGYVTGTGRTFGATLTVTCYDAYTMTRGTGTVTCSSGGSWVPEHMCEVNQCSALTLPNGVVTPNTAITSDVSVTVNCSGGFVEDGFANPFVVKCSFNGTWLNRPKCSSGTSGTACEPHGVVNVQTTPSQPIRNVQTTFVCVTGHRLTGSQRAMCNSADGTWGQLPSCTPYSCSTLNLTHSAAVISGAVSGTPVSVQCKAGYSPSIPLITPSCNSVGEWSTTPTCLPNQCSSQTVSDGTLAHLGPVVSGSTPTLTCKTGFIPLLTIPVTCGANGGWGTTPACQSCGGCLQSYNNEFPAELKQFSSIPTYATTVSHCNTLLQYEACFRRAECSNTVVPTDGVWVRENQVLNFICRSENLQALQTVYPCLRDSISGSGSTALATCKSKLVKMTANNVNECSAPADYFSCLSGEVGTSVQTSCSGNVRASAKVWIQGFTANLNTVPVSFCDETTGGGNTGHRPRTKVITLTLCLLMVFLAKFNSEFSV